MFNRQACPLHAALVWGLCAALPASAESCRQALILGLDVSLSVDPFEFRLQREGLAQALTDPQVADAMISPAGDHVELAVFEWSAQFDQALLVDWTVIDSGDDLSEIAQRLRTQPQQARLGRTGLGAAMRYARDRLDERPQCARRTLDLSGDGVNNSGIAPERVKTEMTSAGIVVNGLVIGFDAASFEAGEFDLVQLSQYFLQNVIVGPSAFVETVDGFDAYGEAMKRKLLRELAPSMASR